MSFSTKLPTALDQVLQNLEAALRTMGSGGSDDSPDVRPMRLDHRTGAATYGRDATPVPLQHRYATPLVLMRHGFKVWEGNRVVTQVMETIVDHPLPVPRGSYVEFGQNGPRKATEAVLLSMDEPGLNLVFSALSVSNENGIGRLVADAVTQIRAGHTTYSTPVIQIVPQLCTYRKFGTTGWAFGHKLLDYVSDDGSTLWSKAKMVADPAELPWDTGEDE